MTNENRQILKDYGANAYLLRKLDKAFPSTRFFKCEEDLQGADFKVGQVMSVMDWLVWVVEDRNMGDGDALEVMKYLSDIVSVERFINWICDLWELNIVEVTAKPHFYYIDECVGCEEEWQEYDDEADFFEGMLWNRDVAKEYGDKVPTIRELKELFTMYADAESSSINGAHFVKLTTMTIDEYMERGL